jgi:hypothetical protein
MILLWKVIHLNLVQILKEIINQKDLNNFQQQVESIKNKYLLNKNAILHLKINIKQSNQHQYNKMMMKFKSSI